MPGSCARLPPWQLMLAVESAKLAQWSDTLRKPRCCTCSSAMRKSAEPFSGKDNVMPRAEKAGAAISAIFRENSAAPAIDENDSNAYRAVCTHRPSRFWKRVTACSIPCVLSCQIAEHHCSFTTKNPGAAPGISYSTNLMRYAKFFATNSQFTRLLRKVSTNLGRRLR